MHTIVCFSGGSACNILSQHFATTEHNVTYCISTFDSGRSTGVLRSYFDIPAVGDIRNRMLALVPKTTKHLSAIHLLSKRFPKNPTLQDFQEFTALLNGDHPLIKTLNTHLKAYFLSCIEHFKNALITKFSSLSFEKIDLSELSFGNCVLVGAFFMHTNLTQATSTLAQLLNIHHTILPVCEESATLCFRNEQTTLYGQAHIASSPLLKTLSTGELFLHPYTKEVSTTEHVLQALKSATLIIYPMGSFFTSICASLLPQPIAEYIAKSSARKVYIPNIGKDNEQGIRSVTQCALTLTQQLQRSFQSNPQNYLTDIILDANPHSYPYGVESSPYFQYHPVPNLTLQEEHNPQLLLETLEHL